MRRVSLDYPPKNGPIREIFVWMNLVWVDHGPDNVQQQISGFLVPFEHVLTLGLSKHHSPRSESAPELVNYKR